MTIKVPITVSILTTLFFSSINFTHQKNVTCFKKNDETCYFMSYTYLSNINGTYIHIQQNPDLQCQHQCANSEDSKNCRFCFCPTDYQLDTNSRHRLTIAYIDPDFALQNRSTIQQPARNYSYYDIVHRNKTLTLWPHNLCTYKDIISIDLSWNKLENIPYIGCLSELSALLLSHNRITHVANTTFIGLNYLRVLDISFNNIKSLDPETFTAEKFHILFLDVHHNDLKKLDATNIVLDKPFCSARYSHNKIGEITRETGWLIDINKTYGPGMVDLKSNNLEFVDFFSFIGDQDLFEAYGKLFYFGFDVRDNKWACDCRLVHFLQMVNDVMLTLWRTYFNIRCEKPRHLYNQIIPNLALEGKLDLFICNITEECPKQCHCFNKSSQNTIVIDCHGVGLTSLPEFLPSGNKLEIYLQDNSIRVLDSKEYLSRTSLLNISNNILTTVTSDALNMLKHVHMLDLQNNNLQKIPRAFQNMEPCSLLLGLVQIKCGCGDFWIKDWLRLKQCHNSTNEVECKHENNMTTMINETMQRLGCEFRATGKIEVWAIVVASLSVFLIAFLSIAVLKRKYELFLLCKYNCEKSEAPQTVFISFDEEYDQLREWVISRFVPLLKTLGVRTFVPCLDLTPGCCREEETIHAIRNSHVIVILSRGYFEDESCWTHLEWKYAWKFFYQYKHRKLLLVVFDNLDMNNLSHRKWRVAKAFLRLQLCRDVAVGLDVLRKWITKEFNLSK